MSITNSNRVRIPFMVRIDSNGGEADTDDVKCPSYKCDEKGVWTIPFPDEFVRSKNKKYVYLRGIRYINSTNKYSFYDKDYAQQRMKYYEFLLPEPRAETNRYLSVHATFNQESVSANHLIGFSDSSYAGGLCFEQYTTQKDFKLWIVDEVLSPPTPYVDEPLLRRIFNITDIPTGDVVLYLIMELEY